MQPDCTHAGGMLAAISLPLNGIQLVNGQLIVQVSAQPAD